MNWLNEHDDIKLWISTLLTIMVCGTILFVFIILLALLMDWAISEVFNGTIDTIHYIGW